MYTFHVGLDFPIGEVMGWYRYRHVAGLDNTQNIIQLFAQLHWNSIVLSVFRGAIDDPS